MNESGHFILHKSGTGIPSLWRHHERSKREIINQMKRRWKEGSLSIQCRDISLSIDRQVEFIFPTLIAFLFLLFGNGWCRVRMLPVVQQIFMLLQHPTFNWHSLTICDSIKRQPNALHSCFRMPTIQLTSYWYSKQPAILSGVLLFFC